MSVKVRPYRRGGWEVDVTVRLPNGARWRERSKAPVSSKSAAVRWGEDRERHVLQHGLPQPKREVPILHQHLIPLLGSKKLDAITTEHVQNLKRHLHDRAPKTVNNVLAVLNVLLKKAVEWAALRAALRLERSRHGAERRATSLRAAHGPIDRSTSRAPAFAIRPRVVSGGWIADVGGHREASRRTGGATRTDCAERCTSPTAHVLFTSGDAGRTGAGDSGARGPSGSHDHAAVHASESRGAGQCDPVTRRPWNAPRFWRHVGDGMYRAN